MLGLMEYAFDVCKTYNGRSLFMVLFLCALFYLWITEKDKSRKVILVYLSVALAALFFFPVFIYIMVNILFDNEVYYRTIWLFPIAIVIAFAITKVIIKEKKVWRKIVIGAAFALLIMTGGTYVYSNPTFVKAENLYQVPQVVVDICDTIQEEDQWVRAAMPQELIPYVRQYSAEVRMPYGRESLIERWNLEHPMYQNMENDVIDTKLLAEQGREYWCYYIVIGDNRVMDGKLEDYDYHSIGKIGAYTIYVDGRLDLKRNGSAKE